MIFWSDLCLSFDYNFFDLSNRLDLPSLSDLSIIGDLNTSISPISS